MNATNVVSPLLSVVLVAAAHAQDGPSQEYRALLNEYTTAGGGFRAASTDAQRKAAVDRLRPYPQKFLSLADNNPKHPVAIQSLRQAVQAIGTVDSLAQHTWEINRSEFPVGSEVESASKTVATLLRDHLHSDQLVPVCERMRFHIRTEFETFLTQVIASNEHRNVKAAATYALAQVLNNQLYVLDLLVDEPALVERYDTVFGAGYIGQIKKQGRAALGRRVETRFEQAAEYDDVALPYGGTVGQNAKTELYTLRFLTVGKEAPDIRGSDQDGREFRLSDYRGKVVLLYFWMEL